MNKSIRSGGVVPNVRVPATFAQIYEAWQKARKRKKPSISRWRFERRWLDSLAQLTETLNAGCWQPRHTQCFVVTRPKTREVHAPDFADRVLHHWLVPRLEAVFEPGFIGDSYANRHGKGSHAAVRRLQHFMRQRQDGIDALRGGGYALKLDVHNCFNRIHRPTLYMQLVAGLDKAVRRGKLAQCDALALRSLCHSLLRAPTQTHCVTPLAQAALPPHKRLDRAPPGCGIPVGNLSSQFFVNVYMDRLDQFVKHTLKVRHYIRFVDDLVLLGSSPQQLADWHQQIAGFLNAQLRLNLREEAPIAAIRDGLAFLGYRVYPTHLLVGHRALKHCREVLASFEQNYSKSQCDLQTGEPWRTWWSSPADCARLSQQMASYRGHFGHAKSWRLQQKLHKRFAWLAQLLDSALPA